MSDRAIVPAEVWVIMHANGFINGPWRTELEAVAHVELEVGQGHPRARVLRYRLDECTHSVAARGPDGRCHVLDCRLG